MYVRIHTVYINNIHILYLIMVYIYIYMFLQYIHIIFTQLYTCAVHYTYEIYLFIIVKIMEMFKKWSWICRIKPWIGGDSWATN